MHLMHIHSEPLYKLDSIEKIRSNMVSNKALLVVYTNTKTQEQISQNLKDVYTNKKILQLFNSHDASQIGYAYGRLVFLNEELEK